jgi:hypothetical protein
VSEPIVANKKTSLSALEFVMRQSPSGLNKLLRSLAFLSGVVYEINLKACGAMAHIKRATLTRGGFFPSTLRAFYGVHTMKVAIYNEGERPVRMIVDKDTIDDSQIDARATVEYDTRGGVIELRELEMSADEAEAS